MVRRRSRLKTPASTFTADAAQGAPVTLAQAKRLAVARRPVSKRAAPGRRMAERAGLALVGAERKRLERRQRHERVQRIREYTATMKIMKARGARRPNPKKKGKAPGTLQPKGGSFRPLQIFAEGDSWFDYPAFANGGIIPRLEDRLGVPILNLAKAGDEVRYMLGVKQRTQLAKHLTRGCPVGGPWDVLLFSGGGNDIVDNPMALWIKDYDPALTPAQHLHPTRFSAALTLVQAGYEDLIRMRDGLSPSTHLVFHGYDYAIPDGRGICWLGPWLQPTFKLRKFPADGRFAFEVVKEMLQRFASMLLTFTSPTVTFIHTQGTLAPVRASWHNELHPERDGFKQFADQFRSELKALFPTRVL